MTTYNEAYGCLVPYGNTMRMVSLNLDAPGALAIDAGQDLVTIVTQGQPFPDDSIAYTLRNTGTTAIDWRAVCAPYMLLDKEFGTLPPSESVTVTMSWNRSLEPDDPNSVYRLYPIGLHGCEFNWTATFTDATNGVSLVRPVYLRLCEPYGGQVQVDPRRPLSVSIPLGGSPHPDHLDYTLTSLVADPGESIDWQAETTASWVTVSTPSGTLAPGGSSVNRVSFDYSYMYLPAGRHIAFVKFINTGAAHPAGYKPFLSVCQQEYTRSCVVKDNGPAYPQIVIDQIANEPGAPDKTFIMPAGQGTPTAYGGCWGQQPDYHPNKVLPKWEGLPRCCLRGPYKTWCNQVFEVYGKVVSGKWVPCFDIYRNRDNPDDPANTGGCGEWGDDLDNCDLAGGDRWVHCCYAVFGTEGLPSYKLTYKVCEQEVPVYPMADGQGHEYPQLRIDGITADGDWHFQAGAPGRPPACIPLFTAPWDCCQLSISNKQKKVLIDGTEYVITDVLDSGAHKPRIWYQGQWVYGTWMWANPPGICYAMFGVLSPCAGFQSWMMTFGHMKVTVYGFLPPYDILNGVWDLVQTSPGQFLLRIPSGCYPETDNRHWAYNTTVMVNCLVGPNNTLKLSVTFYTISYPPAGTWNTHAKRAYYSQQKLPNGPGACDYYCGPLIAHEVCGPDTYELICDRPECPDIRWDTDFRDCPVVFAAGCPSSPPCEWFYCCTGKHSLTMSVPGGQTSGQVTITMPPPPVITFPTMVANFSQYNQVICCSRNSGDEPTPQTVSGAVNFTFTLEGGTING